MNIRNIFILIFILCASPVFAANHYILSSATGSNTGSDWTNAWTSIPSTYIRGDVYYIGDGTYSKFTISTAVSGTSRVTILKATVANHGTDTGWSNSFGDGQAIINIVPNGHSTYARIQASYVTIDGVVGDGATTGLFGTGSDPNTYGIKFQFSDCSLKTSESYLIGMPGSGYSTTDFTDNVIRHVAFVGCGSAYKAYENLVYSFPKTHVVTFQYNYMWGGTSNMLIRHWKAGSKIQYNYFAENWTDAAYGIGSSQQISCGGDDDVILSHNIFKNSSVYITGTHGFTYNSYRWKIYNNLIYGNAVVDGNQKVGCGFGSADYATDVVVNWEVHHNTFICAMHTSFGAMFVATLSNINNKSYVYNNMFYNTSNPRMDNVNYTTGAIVHDYNAYYNVTGTKTTETNWIVASGDPFVNAAGSDYHLATSITGTTLASPFDVDYDGVTRTMFSQGLYEYGFYTIGGTISDLGTGVTITLQNNGVDITPISTNGIYSMLTSMATDSTYNITISSQPIGQTCSVINGTGTIGSTNVTNVNITCGLCVSPTGSGTKTGINWNNTIDWSALSTTGLQRNNTYYLADGNYDGKRIATAISGTKYIKIRKATISSHGSNTGWLSSMGDGQSIFKWITMPTTLTSTIDIYTSYIEFDGITGAGADETSYGFATAPTNTDCSPNYYMVGIPGIGHSSTAMSNIKVSHIAMYSPCGENEISQNIGLYSNPQTASDIEVSYNYLGNNSSNIVMRNWTSGIIHDNYFNGNWSASNFHGQQISPGYCNNISLYNNIFRDSTVFVIGAHVEGSGGNADWDIYNNTVIGSERFTSAIWAAAESQADCVVRWKVHHNTHVNLNCGGRGAVHTKTLTDVNTQKSYAYNNLFYNCSNADMNSESTVGSVVQDYNAYINTTGYTTESNYYISSGDPFINSAGSDYHLATSLTGTTLASPFNTDYDGVARTLFSQGAYEFSGIYVGGVVSGLTGTIVLQNNFTDNKTITSNGAYHFDTETDIGNPYSVTILNQPTGMTCVVTGGTGTVTSSVTMANVGCYWTVTASAGEGCNISPSGATEVLGSTQQQFTFTPNSLYSVTSASGTCGGNLISGLFTTNSITADCTVIANCSLLTPGPFGPTVSLNKNTKTFSVNKTSQKIILSGGSIRYGGTETFGMGTFGSGLFGE